MNAIASHTTYETILLCKLRQDLAAIVRSETERPNCLQEPSKQALDSMTQAMVQKIQAMLMASLPSEHEGTVAVLRNLFDRAHFEKQINSNKGKIEEATI